MRIMTIISILIILGAIYSVLCFCSGPPDSFSSPENLIKEPLPGKDFFTFVYIAAPIGGSLFLTTGAIFFAKKILKS